MKEKWWQAFIPKLVVCMRERYTWALFRQDLFAGMTVGLVSLPLTLAFAIASGVSPEKGLFTAVVAGFLISLLGGSRVQIGGPAGAFIVIVYGVVQRHGYEGLVLATIMAAGMLILMGFCRLGNLIKYFPLSLIRGLTAGLGVIVFSLQIKDFFGLPIDHVPLQFTRKWALFTQHFFHFNFDFITLLLGIGTLFFILLLKRFFNYLPWGVTAIVVSTLISFSFGLDVESIYSRFGHIPNRLPTPSFPSFDWGMAYLLIPDACAIALLGGIESLLSAVMGDKLTGCKHKSNCELLAQGIANLGSIIFGGIPATGTIARTAANIHSGAATPIAGIIHSLTILVVMLFFSSLVGYIPMPALAAVIMVVAWNLAEPSHFLRGFRQPKIDLIIMLTTFSLIILTNLLTGVLAGMGVWGAAQIFQKWKAIA